MTRAWPEDISALKFSHDMSRWSVADRVARHITRLAGLYKSRKPNLPLTKLIVFTGLVARAGWFYEEQSNSQSAFALLNVALEIAERNSDTMPVLLADILKSQSSAYAALNQPTRVLFYAEKHFEQRCKTEEMRDPGSIMHAMGYTELAMGLFLNDRFEEALDLSLKAKEMLLKTPQYLEGKYWPHFAIFHETWCLIGLNRASEAQQVLLDTLQWRVDKFDATDLEDPEPFKLAYVLQQLGLVARIQGQNEESRDYLERALNVWVISSGDSYYRANQVRVTLGDIHAELHQPDAARIMYEKAITQFRLLPHRRPEAARALFRKAQFLKAIGEDQEAQASLEEATLIYRDLKHDRKIQSENLTVADFDSIVSIWSR